MKATRVSSRDHPVVKLARALRDRRGRRKHGLALVEGLKAIEAVLESGQRTTAALIRSGPRTAKAEELAARLAKNGARVFELPPALFKRISAVESPQGLVVLCEPGETDLGRVLAGNLVLVADRIQDPGNLGTLLRCARAFGVSAVVSTSGSVEAANPKAVRACAGAWPGIPLAEGVSVERVRRELASGGFTVLVADPSGGVEYSRAPWRNRIALVLGNEGGGADRRFAEGSAITVRIPMASGSESVNVAAAAAILLAEAFRRRTVAE